MNWIIIILALAFLCLLWLYLEKDADAKDFRRQVFFELSRTRLLCGHLYPDVDAACSAVQEALQNNTSVDTSKLVSQCGKNEAALTIRVIETHERTISHYTPGGVL